MALPAPEDVAAVPDNATKTESGLAYRIWNLDPVQSTPLRQQR